MATAFKLDSTQQAFISKWEPYAQAAGQQLGIPWQYVLAQWIIETNWGQQSNMGTNNPGNVGNLGGGHWQNYATPADFVGAYVASMRQDFPFFSLVHKPANPTIAQIFNGYQRYDPGTTQYGTHLTGAYATVADLSAVSAANITHATSGHIYGQGQDRTPTTTLLHTIQQRLFGVQNPNTSNQPYNPVSIPTNPFLQALANAALDHGSGGVIAQLTDTFFLLALALALFGAGLFGLVWSRKG